jgi:hypothetical protein
MSDALTTYPDWSRWSDGFFGPVIGLEQSARQLNQHLTVAATHPHEGVRGVRLEMAAKNVAAIRAFADELELAIVQAQEQLKRQARS